MIEVTARYCKTYEKENIKQIIYQIFSTQSFLSKLNTLNTVLLKPNLLGPYSPEKGITTHPEFIAAVIEILKDYNIKISLSDSPGGTIKYRSVLQKCGILDLAERYNFEIIDPANSGISKFIKSTSGRQMTDGNIEYIISKPFVECEALINLPKLKTHTLTLFTGAIKNCYGTVPGLAKSNYHRIAPNPTEFAKIIVDIYAIIKDKIVFNLMDGVIGMDGDGPSSGDTKNFGVILGSSDAVALDFCASRMIGYKPNKIPTILFASEKSGISLQNIKLTGDFEENFTLKNVSIRRSKITNLILGGLSKPFKGIFQKLFWMHPDFLPEKCTKCGNCAKSCPVSALTISSVSAGPSPDGNEFTIPQLDREKCILCLCCIEMCPESAVYMKKSLLGKFLIR